MVTGKELESGLDQDASQSADSNCRRIEDHPVGISVRFVTRLRGAVENQAPLGYEDEGGFHYGADLAE